MRKGTSSRRRESGQSTLEYVGVVTLAAILVISLAGVWQQSGLDTIVARAICQVQAAIPWAGGDCGSGSTGGDNGGGGQTKPTDIPADLDPNSDLVKTLMLTETGRATLQWLFDNNIPIVTDETQKGAYWNGSEIVMGKGYDNAAVLVHETNHARYAKEGRHADVNRLDRDAYIKGAIDEEADGVVQQIKAAQEFRKLGKDIPEQPAEGAYNSAYTAAKKGGASDAEAEAAGSKAVNEEFYNGHLVSSVNGKSYPENYGDDWDNHH